MSQPSAAPPSKPPRADRPTLKLLAVCDKLGFDYFEALTKFAMGDHGALGLPDPITASQRLTAIMEGCQYLYPKRKAVELSGPDGGPLDVLVAMSPEERQRRIAQLQEVIES